MDVFRSVCIVMILFGIFLLAAPDCRDARDCEHEDINGNKPVAEHCVKTK